MLRFQSTLEKLRFDYFEGMHDDGHKHWSSEPNNLLFNILLELVTVDSNCKKARTEGKLKRELKSNLRAAVNGRTVPSNLI